MDCVVNILEEWNGSVTSKGVKYQYPISDCCKGLHEVGFIWVDDRAFHLQGWYGFMLSFVSSQQERDFITDCEINISFTNREDLSLIISLSFEEGVCSTSVSLTEFPAPLSIESIWQFVSAISLEWEDDSVSCIACNGVRDKGLHVNMQRLGLSGEIGEEVVYSGTIYNCTNSAMVVSVTQSIVGWESMYATVTPSSCVTIEPLGEQEFTVVLTLTDYMVAGGHEDTLISITGRIYNECYEKKITLTTMCYLPHPYLYHTQQGFDEVMKKIQTYPEYEKAFLEYQEKADEYQPQPSDPAEKYCYKLGEEDGLMSCGYMYALTKEQKYAEKLVLFYEYFTDEATGYPKKLRGCDRNYVQEGHFFKHLLIPLDIIYDTGFVSEELKEKITKCLYLYMDDLDYHVRNGHITNWTLSELVGAVYAAMVIQDFHYIQRFVYESGGVVDQFKYGMLNDGWWHECSVGYNTWVSSMMIHMAHSMQVFGYDLAYEKFPIPYNKSVSASYGLNPEKVRSGMVNEKWGGNLKNFVTIKDMFDATLPFLDDRGVIFGISDSDEKKLEGIHYGSTYELAYHYYKDPEYIPIIQRLEKEPMFGIPILPKYEGSGASENAYADNIGIVMLRSKKKNTKNLNQIQAVLRYGSHGGAHGHFDTASLLSVMRYGRSLFNPEHVWWGYAHFMYKFYVQCSLTKNMVVVDDKMQIPADSKRILLTSSKGLQVAGVEISTEWAFPPYGGMVYYQNGQSNTIDDLKKRCEKNSSYLPIVNDSEVTYGEMSHYTEKILQRRVMAVTDDYIVLFDYLQGEEEHTFRSLLQIKGFLGIEGENVTCVGHTEQMSTNPLSDAQFITDCSWYNVQSPTVAHFETIFTEEDTGKTLRADRSNYNEVGSLKIDAYTAWPTESEQMVGRVALAGTWPPDGRGYTIPLSYEWRADDTVLQTGEFNGWILGRESYEGTFTSQVKELTFIIRQGDRLSDFGAFARTAQGIFMGEIILQYGDGSEKNLGELLYNQQLQVDYQNIDQGYGIGKDYQKGRVTIVGTEYSYAIPCSTEDHNLPGIIKVNVAKEDLVGIKMCIGIDAFPGEEQQKRKTYGVKTKGTKARFITVIEPFENQSVVRKVEATDENQVVVTLIDGKVQTLRINHMEGGIPEVILEE